MRKLLLSLLLFILPLACHTPTHYELHKVSIVICCKVGASILKYKKSGLIFYLCFVDNVTEEVIEILRTTATIRKLVSRL